MFEMKSSETTESVKCLLSPQDSLYSLETEANHLGNNLFIYHHPII